MPYCKLHSKNEYKRARNTLKNHKAPRHDKLYVNAITFFNLSIFPGKMSNSYPYNYIRLGAATEKAYINATILFKNLREKHVC